MISLLGGLAAPLSLIERSRRGQAGVGGALGDASGHQRLHHPTVGAALRAQFTT